MIENAKDRILVVEDEPRSWEYLDSLLQVDGCDVETIASGEDVIERVQQGDRPDVIILQHVAVPGLDGLDTLKRLMQSDRSLDVIVLSCSGEVRAAAEAMRLGARDFLTLPFDRLKLEAAIRRCRRERKLSRAIDLIPQHCDPIADDWFFLAAAPPMVQIRRQILQVAPVDLPVLISGESGVGKEVVARMIHARSLRRCQPFVKVNCAALPGELLESELFGYERGAFTGAVRPQVGKFQLANRGTIFLDEIAEMSPHLQAKLLHVLQDLRYSRLGGCQLIDADVRVVAATNVPLEEAIHTGRLREDLYYRLNVFSVKVPPLRERASEIPMFLRYFHQKFNSAFHLESPPPCEDLLEAAMRYHWPGNLRELENFVKRYAVLNDPSESLRELLELVTRRPRFSPPEACANGIKAVVRGLKDEAERKAIADALAATCWNQKSAAKNLGISYKALLYKMRQLDIRLLRQPGDGPRRASLVV